MTETTSIEITVKQLDSLILNYYRKYFNDENITLTRTISSDSYEDDIVFTRIKRKVKVGEYPAKKRICNRIPRNKKYYKSRFATIWL